MSRTTVAINQIKSKLDEVSGLDGIVADKMELLLRQVNEEVQFILENHPEASAFNYYGFPEGKGEKNGAKTV